MSNYGLDPYNCTMINLSRHLTISYPVQGMGATPSSLIYAAITTTVMTSYILHLHNFYFGLIL